VKAAPLALFVLLFASAIEAATVTFISPLDGSQAVGVGLLEVATNAAAVDRVDFLVDGALAGVARKPPYRIAHDFGTSLAAHEVVARVYSNGYRTTDSAHVTTAALTAGESVNVDLVEVPLRVRAARPLAAADLRVRENGVEQDILEVRPQRAAARFVFVVDRSLSMGGGRLEAALRALDGGWSQLRSDDRVELVLFNHNVTKARRLAPGERVSALFGDVTPSGGTSLRDAVRGIGSSQRTYAIVITDGGDRNSQASEEEALRAVSGTKVVVDALVLGEGSRFLERAAKNTGGEVASVRAEALAGELRRLLADINSRYTVVYQSHGNAAGWRAISVTPRSRAVEILAARTGYFAP
jgi:hypothetical protein